MALSAIAWTAMILVVVFLSLTFAPNWSLVILILVGKIAQAFDKIRKKIAPGVLPLYSSGSGGWGGGPAPPAPSAPPAPPTHPIPLAQDPGDPEDLRPDTTTDQSYRSVSSEDSAADASATAVDAAGPASSSTPSSLSEFKYQVFLNFSRTDTGRTIVGHLFKALLDVSISFFKEDENPRVHIVEAIQQSRISIAIFSTDYASNRWCLMQLVQMWKCKKSKGQIIIPIFYGVSPSDVGNQDGEFGKAFGLHDEERGNSERTKEWREVLRDVAKLPGYTATLYKGYDDQLSEEVVSRVARIFRDEGLAVTDKLVGINLHVQEMMRKLGVADSEGRETEVRGEDVRVIGICGAQGVGKTTLAKVVFNNTRGLFDGCSFLPGISSKGIQLLRRMLIADLQIENPAPLESAGDRIDEIASLCSNAKVLIVLDDVDEDEQIKALAGKLTWFGSGSRIIVTTRNREVLSAFDVGANGRGTVEEHKIEPMSDCHALQLFRYHAIAMDDMPPRDTFIEFEYESLSRAIVETIGGVPADIVHHASALRNQGIGLWRHTLRELQKLGVTAMLYESVMQEDYDSRYGLDFGPLKEHSVIQRIQ